MTNCRRSASNPFVLGLVCALVLGLAAPADAAVSSATRRREEQIKAERAKKATELSVLKASDDELEAAVAALAAQVKVQAAKLASARRTVAASEAAMKRAEAQIAVTEAEIRALQREVTLRAVAAYVRPQSNALADLAEARDLGEAGRRAAMLRQVANSDHDVIDQLRAAREDLSLEREKADAARRQAAERREAERAQLSAMRGNLADQSRLEKALQARINEITGEAEALAKEDAAVASVIRQAEAEAATRSAASAARAAAAVGKGGGSADTSEARTSGTGMRWPVSGTVTSGFGSRWGRLHAGIDIAASGGTPIRAATAGRVIFAGWQGGYGNAVIIDHGGGLTTLYGHQSRLGSRAGQEVDGGDVIGYVGSTGHSTGNHLHFETRVGATPQNPRRYLP